MTQMPVLPQQVVDRHEAAVSHDTQNDKPQLDYKQVPSLHPHTHAAAHFTSSHATVTVFVIMWFCKKKTEWWHGYVSGSRCRFACGPDDATVLHLNCRVLIKSTEQWHRCKNHVSILHHCRYITSGICWAICKYAPYSRQITMLTSHHLSFYRPDALPAAQPTASKHWRHRNCVINKQNKAIKHNKI